MRVAIFVALALLVPSLANAQVSLPAEYRLKAGRLGRIEAKSANAVKWINLHDGLDLIADSSGKFAFVLGAIPGKYKIAAFTCGDDGPSEPAYCVVVVEGPDAPPGGPGPAPSGLDPVKAICKLRFGNAGCTATVIGPRRPDGYWSALTAAHCTGGVGSVGQITLHDGRAFPCKVTARDTTADLSWLRIEDGGITDVPFAKLATEAPAVGTKVWHQGFGIDRPGNREVGRVTGGVDSNGQLKFELSVSSGDSGSAIYREDTGDLVGVVCCTSSIGSKVTMWGGASTVALKMKVSDDRLTPIYVYPVELHDNAGPTHPLHKIQLPRILESARQNEIRMSGAQLTREGSSAVCGVVTSIFFGRSVR